MNSNKFRDNIKNVTIMDDDNATYLLFGIENQTNIHYAMPVRNMLYDALNYSAQVDDTAKYNNDNKEPDREFLTGRRNALYVFENFSNAIKINKKVGDNMITPEIEKEYKIFYGKKARIAGRAEGRAEGKAESKAEELVRFTDNLAKKFGYEKAYELLEISEEEYIQAKEFLEKCKNSDSE